MTGACSDLRLNGTYPVRVKTINGSFVFDLQRFRGVTGSTNYFCLAGLFPQHSTYESTRLKSFVSYWATRLSYSLVSALAVERCSNVSMSDQHIQAIVLAKAHDVSLLQKQDIATYSSQSLPILGVSDIYSADKQEVIWYEDGISVSEQKSKRDKIAKKGKERTTTDMILLEKPCKGYDYLVASGEVCLTALSAAKLKEHYGGREINIVVLSDGARTIKNRCEALFGDTYVHILDWYHLQKKVKDLMSMIAPNKEAKAEYIKELNELLWVGNGVTAIEKLEAYKVKNVEKQAELVGYLKKNTSCIINYEKRKAVGKNIGSGKMEKAVDIIVAKRQKEKAMTWSKAGSNALAVLSAVYKNNINTTENLH